jgi:hypothetical protein
MPKIKTYDVESEELFKISRTGVQLYLNCARCFSLKYKFGISQISGPPFTINSAVDHLLKKEFDVCRDKKIPHPLMQENNIDAIPFSHELLDQWRYNFKGVQYDDHERNFHLFGAIDDVWIHNKTNKLIVADYKATAKDSEVNIDAPWQISYKNQMEFYQWLLRKNGYEVDNEGWFVYCNGRKSEDRFDGVVKFDIKMIPYVGNDDWIEPTLDKIKDCLNSDKLPDFNESCDHCTYTIKVSNFI